MKHIKLLPIALLLLISCSSQMEDSIKLDKNSQSFIQSNIRSITEATNICNQLIDSKKTNTRSSQIINVQNVYTILNTTTRAGHTDTIMYAVDFGNNSGFALIAADKRIEPILAIIDEGAFNDMQNENNESYQLILANAKSYASSVMESITPDTPKNWYEYSDTIYVDQKIAPRITVKWNQGWPENIYCPNQVAGCGPVAAAQILSYLQKPTTITYSFPEKDINSETLNWPDLTLHKKSDNFYSPSSDYISSHYNSCKTDENGHKTIARIIREIGHRANASYDYTTGVIYSDIINTLTNISGQEVESTNFSMRRLYDDLKNIRKSVAFVSGIGEFSSGELCGGHAWVADGTLEIGVIINYWSYSDFDNTVLECTTEDTTKKYVHFNWGIGGNCNGYFLIDVLNPNEAFSYDDLSISNSANNASYSYNFKYCILTKE